MSLKKSPMQVATRRQWGQSPVVIVAGSCKSIHHGIAARYVRAARNTTNMAQDAAKPRNHTTIITDVVGRYRLTLNQKNLQKPLA